MYVRMCACMYACMIVYMLYAVSALVYYVHTCMHMHGSMMHVLKIRAYTLYTWTQTRTHKTCKCKLFIISLDSTRVEDFHLFHNISLSI